LLTGHEEKPMENAVKQTAGSATAPDRQFENITGGEE